MSRKKYNIDLTVNGRRLTCLIIDSHYKAKHGDSITDKIIIELVKMLDGGFYKLEAEGSDGFQYFVEDNMGLEGKTYKLIWILHEDQIFIGVVNCYRRS